MAPDWQFGPPLPICVVQSKENEMREGTGRYRIHSATGVPNTVFVVDRSISFEIGESLYRERGYLPSLDELEWKED